jgi:hypothetical protein
MCSSPSNKQFEKCMCEACFWRCSPNQLAPWDASSKGLPGSSLAPGACRCLGRRIPGRRIPTGDPANSLSQTKSLFSLPLQPDTCDSQALRAVRFSTRNLASCAFWTLGTSSPESVVYTATRLAPPSPRYQALSCLGLPRGLGGLGA